MAAVGRPDAMRRITVHYADGEEGCELAAGHVLRDQVAADFEYARQLQEMERLTIDGDGDDEQDDMSCVASPSDTDGGDGDGDGEDEEEEEDSHNMTYEQGQALVESVGNESRGLSDELISYLVPSKYKLGFFTRKTNHEICPICLSAFRNRESLITLPCKHNYHTDCITKWLKVNKACPVCKYEVFGPS